MRSAVKVLNSMRSRLVISERGCHPQSDGKPPEVTASRGQRLQTIFGNLAKTVSSGARQLDTYAIKIETGRSNLAAARSNIAADVRRPCDRSLIDWRETLHQHNSLYPKESGEGNPELSIGRAVSQLFGTKFPFLETSYV